VHASATALFVIHYSRHIADQPGHHQRHSRDFSLGQLGGSSPFFVISGAVEKVTVDWVVDVILY